MAQVRLVEVVEGWTGRLLFTLKSNGVAFNGTGMTLSGLALKGSDGVAVDVTGQFDWVAAGSGTVYYDPAAGELLAAKSPYSVHYEVTSAGKKVYFPNGAPGYINVYAP